MSVFTKARLYFFTPEVRAVFHRAGLRLEDSLSFETVKKHLSLKDAAKLVAVGRVVELLPILVGVGVGSDFLDSWKQSAHADDQSKIQTIELMAREDRSLIEIQDELFNAARLTEQGVAEPFKIELFAAQAIGVTFAYGGLADLQTNPSKSRELLRNIVKSMCVYEPYGAVMAKPIGLRYIESL